MANDLTHDPYDIVVLVWDFLYLKGYRIPLTDA